MCVKSVSSAERYASPRTRERYCDGQAALLAFFGARDGSPSYRYHRISPVISIVVDATNGMQPTIVAIRVQAARS